MYTNTFQGCGRGYEVVMLALHGFDACGLEISQTAVAEAEKYASGELKEQPSAWNFGSVKKKNRQEEIRGVVKFVEGDFFRGGWEGQGCCDNGDGEGKFDLIYDYTVSFVLVVCDICMC